ncbi:MAG: heme exporter protein CcmD [Alphaproteobacteria bacterium]
MADLSGFLAMGGYAAFVWPAYGIATLVLVGMLAVSLRSLRRRERMLDALRAARRGHSEDQGEGLE